jgi:hypothetical protein
VGEVASEAGNIDCNYGVQMLPEGSWSSHPDCMTRLPHCIQRDIAGNNHGANVTLEYSRNEQLIPRFPGAEGSADGMLRHAPVSCRHKAAAVLQWVSQPVWPAHLDLVRTAACVVVAGPPR